MTAPCSKDCARCHNPDARPKADYTERQKDAPPLEELLNGRAEVLLALVPEPAHRPSAASADVSERIMQDTM